MDIQNNFSSLKDIFQGRYTPNASNVPSNSNPSNALNLPDVSNVPSSTALDKPLANPSIDILQKRDIQDSFTPSAEYSKILEAKDIVKGGLKDVDSFISMAQNLKKENILNSDDIIAVDFLAKQSPKLDFDEFNKIMKNDHLSMEMRGLITTLVQKLEMIDYLSKGAMSA